MVCRLSTGTKLSVALVTGKTSLEEEQLMLVGSTPLSTALTTSSAASHTMRAIYEGGSRGIHKGGHRKGRFQHHTQPSFADFGSYGSIFSNKDLYQSNHTNSNESSYGCSNVDILVCTPGRLLEHLQHTSGHCD